MAQEDLLVGPPLMTGDFVTPKQGRGGRIHRVEKRINTGSQALHRLQHFIPANRIESISEVQLQ